MTIFLCLYSLPITFAFVFYKIPMMFVPCVLQLTAEELALRDRRRMSNRLAARKCRNKKKFRLKENKKVKKTRFEH